MPCNCGTKTTYTATRPDGSQASYRTEWEAAADVRRNGGSYSSAAA